MGNMNIKERITKRFENENIKNDVTGGYLIKESNCFDCLNYEGDGHYCKNSHHEPSEVFEYNLCCNFYKNSWYRYYLEE
jgi:hypothetical protein